MQQLSRRTPKEGLPGPTTESIRKINSSKPDSIAGIPTVAILICFILTIMFIWIVFPSEDDIARSHLQHDITARLYTVRDWVFMRVAPCIPILTMPLTNKNSLNLKNPNFNSLDGWNSVSGRPSVSSTGDDNTYWVGGNSGTNSLSCSSQVVDLPKDSEFTTYLQQRRVMINATCDLKRPPINQYFSVSNCGKNYHFCDSKWNDNVWFELRFLKGFTLLGSVRSINAEFDFWKTYIAESIIPTEAEKIEFTICSQQRAGRTNDGKADNPFVAYHFLPQINRYDECSILKQPMLRETGQGEGIITVIWETNSNVHPSWLEWSWGPGQTSYPTVVQTTTIDNCHFVHKTVIKYLSKQQDNFQDATQRHTLFYYVSCGNTKTELFPYPLPPKPFSKANFNVSSRVAFLSDNQDGAQTLAHIMYDLVEYAPDLLVMGGDIVNRGYLAETWAMHFWYPLSNLQVAQRIPIAITRGNHDGESSFAHAYTSGVENKDWFAFSNGPVRFIILDSNADNAVAPQQREWLISELSSPSSQDAIFRIVVCHLPPFTELWSIKEKYNGEEFVRNEWVPVFEKYRVDMVVSGHTHAYARGAKNGVTYAIIGGAGGDLDVDTIYDWKMFSVTHSQHHFVIADFANCKIEWKVYNTENEVIDHYSAQSKSHTKCQ